jgi:hypothetical protein
MSDFTPIGTDQAAEEATLAAGLQSIAARKEARRHIGSEDFHEPACAAIWDAMSDLDRKRQTVDPTTVRTALGGNKLALEVLLRVMAGHHATPDAMASYAEAVRSWAVRRRLDNEAIQVRHLAANQDIDALGLSSMVAARFAQVRDSGAVEDVQSITLDELLDSPDDEPEWVIPGLLERRDRFMLTGSEGLGKSYLLRQVAIMAAAGLDPFDMSRIEPRRVLIVDCENSLSQVKRKSRAVVELAQRHGKGRPGRVNLLCSGRIDILRDKDLAMIHREVDAVQPEILVIGPLYAMSPKALMTDDDAVPVLAALDGLRECGAALLMEAHAGHAMGADGRNFRPRGSSSLLGWPEFGYGMKPVSTGYADLVPWRGDRDARNWPTALRHDRDGIRWVVHDGRGHEEPGRAAWSPSAGATA